jgi:hypothetical protein
MNPFCSGATLDDLSRAARATNLCKEVRHGFGGSLENRYLYELNRYL